MPEDYPDDPKLTYALIKLQDCLEKQQMSPDPDFLDITTHRDQAIGHYQSIFRSGHIPALTKDEFESFLYYENNHHWTGLHRVKKHLTQDMPLLRRALNILLDDSRPVRERINKIRPYYKDPRDAMVPFLGLAVLSAILLVAHPQEYGVWNKSSDDGLSIVGLWDPRWEGDPAGDVYEEMNRIYLELCHYLKIDLWTLDALWWVLRKGDC